MFFAQQYLKMLIFMLDTKSNMTTLSDKMKRLRSGRVGLLPKLFNITVSTEFQIVDRFYLIHYQIVVYM